MAYVGLVGDVFGKAYCLGHKVGRPMIQLPGLPLVSVKREARAGRLARDFGQRVSLFLPGASLRNWALKLGGSQPSGSLAFVPFSV